MRLVNSSTAIHSPPVLFVAALFLLIFLQGQAQSRTPSWMGFEELQQALDATPKKVLIHFYADWCVYCTKMEQLSYRKKAVLEELRTNYYAVKMNVETADTVVFDGIRFVNKEFGKKRRPVHDIAKLFATREGNPFTLPAIVMLDEQFRVTQRIFRYLPPEELLQILKE